MLNLLGDTTVGSEIEDFAELKFGSEFEDIHSKWKELHYLCASHKRLLFSDKDLHPVRERKRWLSKEKEKY